MFIKRKELDAYLNEILSLVSAELKANYDYFSSPKDDLDREIREDYKECYTILDEIREKVHNLKDLEILDEDDIDFVYQCIAFFEGDFIITHIDTEKRKEDERNYKKLSKILNLFY